VKGEDDTDDKIKKEAENEDGFEQNPQVKQEVRENDQARDQRTDREIRIKEEPVDEGVRIKEEDEEVAFVSEKPVLRRSTRRK
jgi:hypothetical protein